VESGLAFGAKLLVSVLGARRRNGESAGAETSGRDVPGGEDDAGRKEGTDDGGAAEERDDQGQG
jgi:hypothetical protein